MAAVTICSDFGVPHPSKKSATLPTVSPSICHEVMGLDAMILVFCFLFFNVELQVKFLIFFFSFIKRLFNSSLLSAIKVVSSYLSSLIFSPAVLIPACDSSSLAFYMMYSSYKLNNQSDNIQPWRTPFPIWSQSAVPCPFLTNASWTVYGFLRRVQGCDKFIVNDWLLRGNSNM